MQDVADGVVPGDGSARQVLAGEQLVLGLRRRPQSHFCRQDSISEALAG